MMDSKLFANFADTKNDPHRKPSRSLFEPKSFSDRYYAAFFPTSEMQTLPGFCNYLNHFP